MNRADILNTAREYVTRDRAATHGDAERNFALIAQLWSAYAEHQFTAHDVAVMMGLMKCARMKANPKHLDSAVDACGYLAIAGEIAATAPVRPADGQVGPSGCPASPEAEKAAHGAGK